MTNIAQHIIDKCGGHNAIADMAGVSVSRVYRWTYPSERGGTGGLIPAQHQQTILDKARERGIDLTPADFFDAPATPSTGDKLESIIPKDFTPGNGGEK